MSDAALPTISQGPAQETNSVYKNSDYQPVEGNWYAAKPYGFRFTPKSGNAKVMYLPISPSNLNISTQFATNLIPTIYGTVEEHSPVRYYDITIEGTTGMVPKYVEPIEAGTKVTPSTGRTAFTVQQSLSTLAGGLFSKTLSATESAVSDTRDIFGRSAITGVHLEQTGYMAFHNLYRFLLQYKKDAAGVIDQTSRKADAPAPLVFFNYKDNNEYSVVIKSFSLRRDKENPMLYFYSISMRGYDLKNVQDTLSVSKADSKQLLSNLGLDGVKNSTILSKAKDVASSARDVLGSLAIGVNQLGR